MRKFRAISTFAITASAVVVACSTANESSTGPAAGGGKPGVGYPLVRPPVVAATPVGFGGSATKAQAVRTAAVKPVHDSVDASADAGELMDGGIAASDASPPPGDGGGPPPGGGDGGGGVCPDGAVCGSPGGGTAAGFAATDINSRFFSGGPTDIFGILTTVDSIVSNINRSTAGSGAACITQPPVAYPLGTFASGATMYAQCYLLQDPLTQFGTYNGSTYIYAAAGTGPGAIAAIVTPIAGTAGEDGGPSAAGDDGGTTQYSVEAWLTIGANNAVGGCPGGDGWSYCSYGVIALRANEATATFEMSVAGLGFGFCGAQLKSDGTNIYATGSPDMGATCGPTQTLCVSAADITNTSTTCTGTSVTSFVLPALGRQTAVGVPGGPANPNPDSGETFAASSYPGVGDQVVLNGTSTDSLTFGPTTPTPGVGEFIAGSGPGPDGAITDPLGDAATPGFPNDAAPVGSAAR